MPCMPKKPRKAEMSPAAFRALLAAAGLTQAQAADRLGVHLNTVSRWARGRTNIAKPSAILIRAAIGKGSSSG